MNSLIKTVKLRVEWINYALLIKINSVRDQISISHIQAAEEEDTEIRCSLLNSIQEEQNKIEKLSRVQLELKKLLELLKQIELRQLLIELEELINSL